MQTSKLRNTPPLIPEKRKTSKMLLYCLFYYPAVFALLYPLFTLSQSNKNEFLETLVFTSVLLLISNFLRYYWLRLLYLIAALVFVYSTVFFETAYFHLYQNKISESTIYILLETNSAEAGDFLSMYFDKQVLTICLVLFIPLVFTIFILVRFLPAHRYFLCLSRLAKLQRLQPLVPSAVLLALLCGVLYIPKLRNRNIVYVAARSFKKYRREAKALQLLWEDKLGGKFTNVTSDTLQEELYVMIIGESTTWHHMSLYNYYRNTNPLLSARKDELHVYTDVVSPHSTTIQSLEKVLTLANYEHPERSKDGSLLQLMNKAGFKTYWLSNQNPIGTYETLVTSLSKAAFEFQFTNTSDWSSNTPPDEKLMIPFQAALSENVKKKFIVLHLMGSHGAYIKRYPAEFDQFHTRPVTPFAHERAFTNINQYDNSILYNDYIVNKIIDLVKKENKKSWVLYFSDHGEDVFETINTAAHTESIGTKPMYDIPFFFWLSEKYKAEDKNHAYITDRKYMTDDLIYTVADMSGVRFSEFDSTRSLVNKNYLVRKRGLSKTVDYDTKFFTK